MKLKSNIALAAGIALMTLVSCNKEKMAVTTPAADKTNTKAIAGKMGAYDYSQPVDKIITDAMGEKVISNPYRIIVTPGTFIGIGTDGNMTVCNKQGPVCEIVVIADKRIAVTNNGSGNDISGGTTENPIVAIQAFPQWPSYRHASHISISQNEDGASIHHVFID